MIIQKTINEVFNTVKIEEVVGDFVNLKRRGVNLIGNCPFHDEKTPSFNVNPTRNIYKCFGCGKGGDSVNFIKEHEKLSFPEAIRFLAAKYRIEVEETANSAEQIEQKQVTDSLYIVNEYAKEYFEDTLFNRSEGRQIGLSYFKERGFLESTIRKWNLGYATEERDGFTSKALGKKYNIDHMRTVGLTTQNDNDFFRSRVMFTIHNVSGKVVGFGGRTLSADKKIPKYINSPESEIYNKRSVLFGLYYAKESIRKLDECILVEGYTDVITLHQGKIENVVAASGTSLTPDQIKLIKRFTPNIKMIFDGDPAGLKAALRGLDLVLEADMNIKLVLLPDGEDPDSYLAKQGPDGFQKYLDEHQEDFLFFKTRTLLTEANNDPIRKTGVIKDIVQSIAKIPDTFKRALYTRQCATMLEFGEEMLVSEVNKIIKADIKAKRFKENDGRPDPDENSEDWLTTKVKLSTSDQPIHVFNDAYVERDVCAVMIKFCDKIFDDETKMTIGQHIMENVMDLMDYYDVPLYARVLTEVFQEINKNSSISSFYFTSHQDIEIQKLAIDILSSPYVYANWEAKEIKLQTQKMPEENYIKDTISAVLRLRFCKFKVVLKEVNEKINSNKEDDIELKLYNYVIKERNELAKQLGTVTL